MTHSVGDTVLIAKPFGWSSHTVSEFLVERVTPKGQVALVSKTNPALKLRLSPSGRIMDDSRYARRFIVDAERAAEIRRDNLLRKLADDIRGAADDLARAARDGDDQAMEEAFSHAAQAIEARRAATVQQGAVEDESAVPEGNAPKGQAA